MSMSIQWSDFSVDEWARLLEAAKEKGRYLYQTCKYENGSLALSYQVMTLDDYERAVRQISQMESVGGLALGALQVCKRETRKLSLSDIFWITEHCLDEKNLKNPIQGMGDDWGKHLYTKIMEEKKDVGTALGEILGSSCLISESANKFYDGRVDSHRTGFFGRLREIISLIQDVFHKYTHFSFVKIFEAKGLEARFKGMTQSVEDAKRTLAEAYLKAMDEQVVAQAGSLLAGDQTPPPKGTLSTPTPVLRRALKTPQGTEAEKAQLFRDKLKEYLGLPITDQVPEGNESEDELL